MGKSIDMSTIPPLPLSSKALIPLLQEAYDLRLLGQAPILYLEGPPGIGKTQIIYQFAEAQGLEVWHLNLSLMSPTDFVAYVPNDKTMRLEEYPNVNIPDKRFSPKAKGILFIDEWTQGHPEVQKPASKLINERRLGQLELPEGVMIVGAGNRTTDKSGANKLLAMLKNRVRTVPVEVDSDAVVSYLIDQGYNPLFPAFLAARPYNEMDDFKPDNQAYFTPRSFEALAGVEQYRAERNIKLDLTTMSGHIGVGRANDFHAFMNLLTNLPSYAEICAAPKTVPVPDKADCKLAVLAMLVQRCDKDTLGVVSEYMRRYEVHLQVLFIRMLAKYKQPLCTSPAYLAWITDPVVREGIVGFV